MCETPYFELNFGENRCMESTKPLRCDMRGTGKLRPHDGLIVVLVVLTH